MIKPTIGRVVWFWNAPGLQIQPEAAIICYVHDDTHVNLVVFDMDGNPQPKSSVFLYQGEGERPSGLPGTFCEWMPYQIGQVAKTEELQKQITKAKV